MSARAIFKATLVLCDATLPVKLYSAIEDRRVHFRLLHEQDAQPVVQEMVRADTEEPVPRDAVVRGFEVEPGTFVMLEPKELASVEAATDRRMRVLRTVPMSAVGHDLLDRPYYLGPDGDVTGYFALAEAVEGDQSAIVTWAMRKRRYVGALVNEAGYLMVVTLRDPREVVRLPSSLRAPPTGFDDKQLALARQLVDVLRGPFEPAAFQDSYREALTQLIERKAAGEAVERVAATKPGETPDLSRALRESLKHAKEKRVA